LGEHLNLDRPSFPLAQVSIGKSDGCISDSELTHTVDVELQKNIVPVETLDCNVDKGPHVSFGNKLQCGIEGLMIFSCQMARNKSADVADLETNNYFLLKNMRQLKVRSGKSSNYVTRIREGESLYFRL
jgi:hypothetical protein